MGRAKCCEIAYFIIAALSDAFYMMNMEPLSFEASNSFRINEYFHGAVEIQARVGFFNLGKQALYREIFRINVE